MSDPLQDCRDDRLHHVRGRRRVDARRSMSIPQRGARALRADARGAADGRDRARRTRGEVGDRLLVHAGTAIARAEESARMRFVDEFRDAELGRVLCRRDRRGRRAGPPLQGDGGLRRPHALDLQVRRRRPAARERRAGARPRLPRLRDPDGPRRRRDRDRPRGGRDLHLLRRHDARAGLGAGRFSDAKAEGADIRMVYSPLDALRIAKSEPRPRRSSSSRSASRPPRRRRP